MIRLRKIVVVFFVAAGPLVGASVARSEPSRASLAVQPVSRHSPSGPMGTRSQAPLRAGRASRQTGLCSPLGRAVSFLAAYHGNPLTEKRAEELASLFYRYGRRWAVNPYLVASVACQESIFRSFPRKVRVRRCRTVIRQGKAETVCEEQWAGERGMMQVIPVYVKEGYRACTGRRRWHRLSELNPAEVNICVGAWLLANKRHAIVSRMRQGRGFVVRGADSSWKKRYAPCSRRHHRFCQGEMAQVCRRYWWVASYNWGSHQLLCGQTARGIDFTGYPIRVLGRLSYVWEHFAPSREIWSSPEDYEFSRLVAGDRRDWLIAGETPPGQKAWVGLRLRRLNRLFDVVCPELW